jgi:hypothetical protein
MVSKKSFCPRAWLFLRAAHRFQLYDRAGLDRCDSHVDAIDAYNAAAARLLRLACRRSSSAARSFEIGGRD